MPPLAIARRVPSAIVRSSLADLRSVSRNSMTGACGNRGPPCSAAEAAVAGVEALSQRRHRRLERGLLERLGGGGQQRAAGEALAQALSPGADLLAILAPGLGDRVQHFGPRGHAMAGIGREVGASVERELLGCEEHVQRPAAATGHPLDGLHVEGVDVRALLAIDLHAHEAFVHQAGRAGILEGLVRHHVTPMAGGIADRYEHRLVLLTRPRERGRSPRHPVDRVLGVLTQVGGGLLR
jgi:hypothetical protein